LYDARSRPYATKPVRVLQEFNDRHFMLECRVTSGGWFGVSRFARVHCEAGKGG